MRLRIRHVTTYSYKSPVSYGLQQVRMTPKSAKGQEILSWTIELEGGRREVQFEDEHGNLVELVSLEPGGSDVTFTAEGVVVTTNTEGVVGRHEGCAPLWYFERPTELTEPGAATKELVAGLDPKAESGIARLHNLSHLVRSSVVYEAGKTHSATSAEDALCAGHGVCQDHAHIFIAAARYLGHPARYVSGYLKLEDRDDQEAGHAWAEAHVESIGWIGFDISNGISPDERYVRVATGLDSRGAAPLSGIRLGAGDESMIVALQVQQ